MHRHLFLHRNLFLPHEQVTTSAGTVLEADHVVSALPSASLAGLLGPAPADAAIAGVLRSMETVDVGVVNVAYAERCLPLVGFGYLVPSWEPSDVLGVIFDSSAFPEQNTCVDRPRPAGGSWLRG